MTALFLDTSSNTLIISIIKDNQLIDKYVLESAREHSVYAVDKLKEVLEKNNLTPNDIDKIFIVNGPGSFTGIRIGVTIAKTYAYALNKEIIPVSSLKMAILGFTNFDNYVSIIPDKRNHSFLGIYNKEYNTVFEGLVNEETLNKKIEELSGSVKKVIRELESSDNKDIDILSITSYYKKQKGVNAHSINPNYLKEVI